MLVERGKIKNLHESPSPEIGLCQVRLKHLPPKKIFKNSHSIYCVVTSPSPWNLVWKLF